LRLYHRHHFDAFLVGLHTRKTVPCLVPKLKRLSLGGMLDGSDSSFLDAIECRWESDDIVCDPLLSIRLHLVHHDPALRPSVRNPFSASITSFSFQVMMRLRALSDGGIGDFGRKSGTWVRMKPTSDQWLSTNAVFDG
jgi:hypothetical protein